MSNTLGDGNDNFEEYLLLIQVANELSTHALTEGGFDGSHLKVKIHQQEEIRLRSSQRHQHMVPSF